MDTLETVCKDNKHLLNVYNLPPRGQTPYLGKVFDKRKLLPALERISSLISQEMSKNDV